MKVFHVYVVTLKIIAIKLVYFSGKKSVVPFHLQSILWQMEAKTWLRKNW